MRFAVFAVAAVLLAGGIALVNARPSTQSVREFHLEAAETEHELYPGKWVKAWTYNGELPGPTLRVTEGDLVRVHFYNNHTLPHTIHFHGSHPFRMDGDDSMVVEPGANTTYEWIAGPPGAYVYHCHVDTPLHIPMGLYGQFIVDPKDGWPTQVDRELFAVFSDWNPKHNVTAETYLFNGKAFPYTEPLQVEEGERVRVFMSSMSDFPVAGHLHGYLPQQVWPSSQPIDVVPLAHAETRVLEFTADNPGAWMFHDHYEQHLTNDGIYPGGGLNAIEVGKEYHGKFRELMRADELIAAARAASNASRESTPDTTWEPAPDAGAPAGPTVAAQDFAFAPATLTMKAGETVTWTNEGDTAHTVTSTTEGGPLKSAVLKPGETFRHTFSEPGTYEYRCVPHSGKGPDGRYSGMVGTVVVAA